MRARLLTPLLLLAALAAGLAACTNPSVPQGHEGYVYRVPLWFGKMTYVKSLRGPGSTGVSWRLYSENVDMRAKSYKEDFQLLTHDNLSVTFEVNTRIKLRDGSVKEIVEEWGGTKWYEDNVKEPLRTIVREEVSRFSATDIQLETPKVRQLVEQMLVAKFKGTPVMIESVDIGQIQFPKEVADAIQAKIAKRQELERQQFVLAKTKKEAAIRVLDALRTAKQQRIISSTLSPLYVQERAVEVYRKLGQSSNKTVIMLPNQPDGTGMPLVLSGGKRKIVTAADEQLLKEMEQRYMHIASEPVPSIDDKPAPEQATPTPESADPSASAPAATHPPAKPGASAPAP
jgi:regulator of protease activity HflC (stomatin/prohibitin superfamily)